jgi:hypothetical protein
MQMTEKDWDLMLRQEMDWAIAQRKELKGGDDNFRMRIKIVGPGGQIANTPLIWHNEEEKRRVMFALSRTCQIVLAQAAIIVSDTRFLNVPGFCKHFKIPEPGPGTWDDFERERLRILKGYDFYMGNLLRDTWEEALMVAIKGPGICVMASTPYRAEGGQYVFEPMKDSRGGKTEVNMLPAWWH